MTQEKPEKNVTQKTAAADTQTAKNRSRQLHTFDDLRKAPKTLLKKVLRQVTVKTIAYALKNSDDDLKQHILSNIGKKAYKEYDSYSKDKVNNEVRNQCRQEILELAQHLF